MAQKNQKRENMGKSKEKSWVCTLRGKLLRERALWVGVCILLFVGLLAAMAVLNRPIPGGAPTSASLKMFVPARVTEVLRDSAVPDAWTEGRRLGSQDLEVELLNGEFKGERLRTVNYLTAYYNVDAKVGTRIIVRLNVDENGEPEIIAIPNYDRGLVMGGLLLVFCALLVTIGGKKGLMALLGLVLTMVCLLFLLIPLALRGAPPILSTVAFVAVAAAGSLLLLTGFTRKTLCATLGCVGGVAAAGILAAVVGWVTPLNGFNMAEAEEMILRATHYDMKVSGLLVCGVLIASLGAVMDVAMSIASACQEIHDLNPKLTAGQLFRSGMNIGRDAMGTMANTLILAFAGSGLNMLILFRAYDYPILQIINSDMIAIEVLQGIAGSIGIILTVPLVAAISASVLVRDKQMFDLS